MVAMAVRIQSVLAEKTLLLKIKITWIFVFARIVWNWVTVINIVMVTPNVEQHVGKFSSQNGEKKFNYPKLDIFEFIFLIYLMLFGSQRRLE